jgi:hypothetical protein
VGPWVLAGAFLCSSIWTLNPQPSTLNPQPSILNPQSSILNPQPSTLNPQPSILNPQPSILNPQSYTAAAHTLAHSWAPISNVPREIPEASRASLPTSHYKSKILNKGGRSFDENSLSPATPQHQGPRSKERYFDPDDIQTRWKKLSPSGLGAGGGGELDGGFDHRRQVAGSGGGSGAFGGDARPFDVAGHVPKNGSLAAIGENGEAVKVGKVAVQAGEICGFDHSEHLLPWSKYASSMSLIDNI